MSKILHTASRLLSLKRIDESKLDTTILRVSKEDVSVFALSSNAILAISTDTGAYFFRECVPLNDNATYVQQRIDLFLRFSCNNDLTKINFRQESPIPIHFDDLTISCFCDYLSKKSKEKSFVKKMIAMHTLLDEMHYSIWSKDNVLSYEQFERIGLTDLPENLSDIARYFVWYMRGAARAKHDAKLVRSHSHGFYNATKSIATGIVARALGLEHLITIGRLCHLYVDEMDLFGELCPMAEGIRAKDALPVHPTPELHRALSDLHLLDTLCFQQDHGPNNYNLLMTNKQPFSVCAFDNDNPNTFFPIVSIAMLLAGCTPLINTKGVFHRPAVSAETAEHILHINTLELRKKLAPYLNFLQIEAFLIRTKTMKKIIRRSTHLLTTENEWNYDIMNRELGEVYGTTYLTKLILSNNAMSQKE
ncbi:MAG: hypothetical protein IKU51_02750 [Clostridia bacterium]|nr:hypothetical protein [Clostridia bacterium]